MMEGTPYHRWLRALPLGKGTISLSWRLLEGDGRDEPFHVERRRQSGAWRRLSSSPVTESTTFQDSPDQSGTWQYRVTDSHGRPSEAAQADSSSTASPVAISVPLNPDDTVGGLAIGDLTNDGRMGYIVRMARGGTVWICGFRHDGALLWEIDTRLPATGDWDDTTRHCPYTCWDVNGDGRSEVVLHTTKAKNVPEHYETAGPDEFATVVDAETAEVVWEAAWPARDSRAMLNVGHLHGHDAPASVLILDGTYGTVTLTAMDGACGEVAWRVEQERPAGHNLDVGDLDGDGSQEVICGGVCYRADGTIRWEAEPFGHTDISKPAAIDPDREGLQIWYGVESGNPGVYFVDKHGQTIFKESFRHAHYGWVARHTAEVPGLQPHTAEDARHEYGAVRAGTREEGHFPIFLPDGSHWLNLTDWQRKNFVPVHWDEASEVCFIVRKENKRVVRLTHDGSIYDLPYGKLPEGGSYGRSSLCADITGDFREEIVCVDPDAHRLLVLANPAPATRRRRSPFDDFTYRHDRSQHGGGYYTYLSPPD